MKVIYCLVHGLCSELVIINTSAFIMITIIIRLFAGVWQEAEGQFEESPIRRLFTKAIRQGKHGGLCSALRLLLPLSPKPQATHRSKTMWGRMTCRSCNFFQGRGWGINTQPHSPLEKEMAPCSSIKFHGQRSRVGCTPWGHKESDMTEQLSTLTLLLHLPSLQSVYFIG